jgi:gliding motility-associated-like protein
MNKLKISGLLLFLFLFSITTHGQNWLTGDGGATNDEALDVTSDTAGNYYVTGYFTTQATFGTTTLFSNGNSDIFIAKYNSAGVVKWAVKAGGSMADRAYSIKVDNSGNLYITGFYYGSATFGTATINSISNSQDVFIAKYNTAGNLIWVKSVGGSDAETGNGITADKDGNVIVTGQFKGTATFGTQTLTSTLDTAGLPSFDIFTTKFDAAGNFLWVEQGKAKFDDRGLDIAVDDANNIFVVGQFSDTVEFDVVHNNPASSAGYLMKYDASGNEKWFVKMIAHQTIVNGIAIDQNNNVLITGDYIGNLQIYSTPPASNTGSFFYKIFVAKFNNSGAVMWVDNDGSDNEVTSKSIALDNQGNAYLGGLFKCRFDEYSQQYGDGVFYSSGYRDVFVTKYSASGVREWFKQFGSNRDDYCSGIAVKVDDKPVIAGSFEQRFNVPRSPAFKLFKTNYHSSYRGSYCSNPNYQDFVTQRSSGQKDIFISSPIDTAQAPFDYFIRSGSVCKQNFLPPCIGNCKDTIVLCGPIQFPGLEANPFEIDQDSIAPQYNYTWSTGSVTSFSGEINTSGIYWLKSERKDGCFKNMDSVDVIIHPIPPPPSVSSNKPTSVCGPDTITLYGTNRGNAVSFGWNSGDHFTPINDSTISVTQSGEYSFSVTNEFRCSNYNSIGVDIQSPLVAKPIIDPHIVFANRKLEATDTISICYGEGVNFNMVDSGYFANNKKGAIPDRWVEWKFPKGAIYDPSSNPTNEQDSLRVDSTGRYTIYGRIMGATNLCSSDTTTYPISRSFYVIVNPLPSLNLKITGPSNVCPGDTVTLYATGYIDDIAWSGNHIIKDNRDSIKVLVASQNNEIYSIVASYTVALTGCSNDSFAKFILKPRNYPLVTISPSNGIICPNDSALLTSELGTKYKWIGPAGDSLGNTQQIYVDVPGYYHCIQTSLDGCTQTSNFIEAKKYNTPYLDVLPSNNLCPDASAVIAVQASNAAVIEWQPPLSGSSISQTVSTAGTYKCRITQCGILTIGSVVITQTVVKSVITSNDTIVCPGDTIVLNGNAGMVNYNWISQNSSNSYLYVTEPGTYILETTHADGCTKMSAPFIVSTRPQVDPPLVSDTTICAGQMIDMYASASDSIFWYNSKSSRKPFYIGEVFTTPVINQDVVFYVQGHVGKSKTVCNSNKVPVHVNVFSTDISATTDRDTIPAGGSTTLHAITDSTHTVTWSPAGSLSNANSFNPIASPLVNTTYTVSILDKEGCRTFATVFIYVIPMNCEPGDVFVPTAFTPNNDGNNDVLYVRGNEISKLYFAVYNRWGTMVFETTDITKGWDGNYNGKEADPAVFDWYIRSSCFNGKFLEKKGNVTLVR